VYRQYLILFSLCFKQRSNPSHYPNTHRAKLMSRSSSMNATKICSSSMPCSSENVEVCWAGPVVARQRDTPASVPRGHRDSCEDNEVSSSGYGSSDDLLLQCCSRTHRTSVGHTSKHDRPQWQSANVLIVHLPPQPVLLLHEFTQSPLAFGLWPTALTDRQKGTDSQLHQLPPWG